MGGGGGGGGWATNTLPALIVGSPTIKLYNDQNLCPLKLGVYRGKPEVARKLLLYTDV